MSDNRARIWFALFVLAVFCLGAGTGILIGRNMGPPPFAPFPLHGGRGGPPLPMLLDRLTSELQLDATQTSQIKSIMDQRRGRLEQVHRDARERFEKEQGELHDAIRAVLRPDQQQKFDRFLEHRR